MISAGVASGTKRRSAHAGADLHLHLPVHNADPCEQPFQLARLCVTACASSTRQSTTPNSSPPSRPTTSEARTWRAELARQTALSSSVAGPMAVAVVDRLEAVEVDEHQRGLRCRSASYRQARV